MGRANSHEVSAVNLDLGFMEVGPVAGAEPDDGLQAGAMDPKETLQHYLAQTRADLVGKLDGLSEYDARRPMTPTGTNLLGLVKHVAYTQLGYFTTVFGRPGDRPFPGPDTDEGINADMWARADESREDILELHRYSGQCADETVAALPLDAPGRVPWWSEARRDVTLHQILVHMVDETARHTGHADILRELIDGQAGLRPGDPNQPGWTPEEWQAYRARLEEAARAAEASLQP